MTTRRRPSTAARRPSALAALALALALAALAACGAGEDGAGSTADDPSGGTGSSIHTGSVVDTVSVVDTGARADDGEDDLAAFEEAVARARAEEARVVVPAGEFHLSGVLELDGVALHGAGRGSTRLVSTDTSAGSIDLTGDGPELARLEHLVPGVRDRSPEPGRDNLTVREATSFRVADVQVVGARGAGIMVRRSHGGVIEGSTVTLTLADGIHLTGGSSEVEVRDNLATETGDDGIAVVSYESDGALTHDVTIAGNRVERGAARGISVVGGSDVLITDNEVVETEAGGIYVAAEAEWQTYGVSDVEVSDNRVVGSPTRNQHASVLVYSSDQPVDDVTFTGNEVLASPTTGFGSWLHPDGNGAVGDLVLEGNRVADSAAGLWEPTRFEAGRVTGSGNEGF